MRQNKKAIALVLLIGLVMMVASLITIIWILSKL
jgi:hypothetical protein